MSFLPTYVFALIHTTYFLQNTFLNHLSLLVYKKNVAIWSGSNTTYSILEFIIFMNDFKQIYLIYILNSFIFPNQGPTIPQSQSARTHLIGIVALIKIRDWFYITNNIYLFFLDCIFYRREGREKSWRKAGFCNGCSICCCIRIKMGIVTYFQVLPTKEPLRKGFLHKRRNGCGMCRIYPDSRVL